VFLLLYLRVAVGRVSFRAQVHQKEGSKSSDQKQLGGKGLRVSKDRLYGSVARIVQKLLLRVQNSESDVPSLHIYDLKSTHALLREDYRLAFFDHCHRGDSLIKAIVFFNRDCVISVREAFN
jgi:hypothetical protein